MSLVTTLKPLLRLYGEAAFYNPITALKSVILSKIMIPQSVNTLIVTTASVPVADYTNFMILDR